MPRTPSPDDMITGVVRTSKVGSDCEFDICTRAEWDALTEDEQTEALLDAANGSGMFEIHVKD